MDAVEKTKESFKYTQETMMKELENERLMIKENEINYQKKVMTLQSVIQQKELEMKEVTITHISYQYT